MLIVRTHVDRRNAERDALVTQAWLTARLSRAQTVPELERLLAHDTRRTTPDAADRRRALAKRQDEERRRNARRQ